MSRDNDTSYQLLSAGTFLVIVSAHFGLDSTWLSLIGRLTVKFFMVLPVQ